jgi:hypothetical protein
MQIWILSKGERHEGGSILGVYADRDLARGAFLTEARILDGMFGISDAQQDDDGALHLEGGCDWVSLEPHAVIDRQQIEAADDDIPAPRHAYHPPLT